MNSIPTTDPANDTLAILGQLRSPPIQFESAKSISQSESNSDSDNDSSTDEYVYVIQDPRTGEEIEIASGDLPPDLKGKQLYYDPIKRTFLTRPNHLNRTISSNHGSIIDQLNQIDNISPPMNDGSSGEITFRGNMTARGNKTSRRQLTGDEELLKLNRRISRKIGHYNVKANIYRILNYFVNIGAIVITSAIGFLIATDRGTPTILAIMAFGVSLVKGIHELLKLGSLGIIYKGLAIRLQTIFREVQEARGVMVTDEEKKRYASLVFNKLSEMDLETFKASYGPRVLKEDSDETPLLDDMAEPDDYEMDIDSDLIVSRPQVNPESVPSMDPEEIIQPAMDDMTGDIEDPDLESGVVPDEMI